MGVMSVAYTTINGQIVSEKRNGVPSDYIPDALGSTIALLSDTHQITDRWTYWPNGQVRSHTGSSITPFTYGGILGYRSDVPNTSSYARARLLRSAVARWQTLDPTWPASHAYAYSFCNPSTYSDPSGLNPCLDLVCYPACATAALSANRYNTNSNDLHHCCHNVAHCAVCCALTEIVSPGCALIAQTCDNQRANDQYGNFRLNFCLQGVALGSTPGGGGCVSKCLRYCQNRGACPPAGLRNDPRCKRFLRR
jgi:RHS repeat-associated protein